MNEFLKAISNMSLMSQLVLLDALTKEIQEKVDPETFGLVVKALIGEAE